MLTVLGVHNGWLAVAPVLAAVAAAIALRRRWPRRDSGSADLRPAVAALLGWALVSVVGPSVAGDPVTPLGDGPAALTLVALARGRVGWPRCWRSATGSAAPSAPTERLVAPGPRLGERIS